MLDVYKFSMWQIFARICFKTSEVVQMMYEHISYVLKIPEFFSIYNILSSYDQNSHFICTPHPPTLHYVHVGKKKKA